MAEPLGCLKTGCNNVQCEHLTWGPPYCMLRAEGTPSGIENESKQPSSGYEVHVHGPSSRAR